MRYGVRELPGHADRRCHRMLYRAGDQARAVTSGAGMVAGSNANARVNWVCEMTASVENDANHSVRVRKVARTGLEVLARAFGISIAHRDHPRSWSFDDLRGKLQRLEESADRLRTMY